MQYKKISFVDCGSTKPIHFKEKEMFLENLNKYYESIVVENHEMVEFKYASGLELMKTHQQQTLSLNQQFSSMVNYT